MQAQGEHPFRSFITSIFSILLIAGAFLLCFKTELYAQRSKKDADKDKFGKSLKKFENKALRVKNKIGTPSSSDDEIIAVRTDLVMTDTLVIDPKGGIVIGLKKEDFVVTEDGVRQEIEIFSPAPDVPKSIVLIVETGIIPSFADRSLDAAKLLVDKLSPNDLMAIVATDVRLVQNFTNDKKLLKDKLQHLKKEHRAGRHDYSTLIAVLDELLKPEYKRPIVINQSFGGELSVLIPMWEFTKKYCERKIWGFCERNFSFSDVENEVERSRATIYSVIPGPRLAGVMREQQTENAHKYLTGYLDEIRRQSGTEKEKEEFRRKWVEIEMDEQIKTQAALMRTAVLSGGYTSFFQSVEDALPIYEDILKTIENRYNIGYYSTDDSQTDKKRNVKIEVRGHPEYVVHGRKTFVRRDQ